MSTYWYESVAAKDPLMQGDIIYDCPVFYPDPKGDHSQPSTKVKFVKDIFDIIILSQSCDLQKCPAERTVTLCPVKDITDLKEGHIGNLLAERIANLHLLNKQDNIPIDFKVVDFSMIFTLPFGFLDKFKQQTNTPRPRLKSPYVEQMAQRFGMSFMRVGTDDRAKPNAEEVNTRLKELHHQKEAEEAKKAAK